MFSRFKCSLDSIVSRLELSIENKNKRRAAARENKSWSVVWFVFILFFDFGNEAVFSRLLFLMIKTEVRAYDSSSCQIKRSLSQNACGCLCVCLFFSKLYHVAYSCSVFFISTHTNTGLEPNRPQASKTPADIRVCNGQISQIGLILNHILVSCRKNTGSLNSNQKANIRLRIVHGATP